MHSFDAGQGPPCGGAYTAAPLAGGRRPPNIFRRGPALAARERDAAGPWRLKMNYLRTAILLAGLTALFMGVGYLIGGKNGALIALAVAAVVNLFSYWNSDKL